MPPGLRSGAVAERSNPMPKARGGGRKELPHVQEAGQLEGLWACGLQPNTPALLGSQPYFH